MSSNRGGVAVLRFTILGAIRASSADGEIELGPPQQRALLALLLLRHGEVVTADWLVDALWGEEPPHRAVGTIRTYIWKLRNILGDAVEIDSAHGGYRIRLGTATLDLQEFAALTAAGERLRHENSLAAALHALTSALTLWQGAALAGVPGSSAEAARAQLCEQWMLACESRLHILLDLGRYAEATPDLTRLVAAHPLRERLCELLMRALHGSGRRAEALDVYASARRRLIEELGIEPGARLMQAHRRILAAEAAVEPPVTSMSNRIARSAVGPLPAPVLDFTGRSNVVRDLTAYLRPESTGSGIVTISGVGGSGKTALAVHVAHAVAAEFPDGQFYVDLRGLDDTPADSMTVLEELIGVLGGTGDLPATVSDRSALLRRQLSGKRVLLLLDNAADAAQVAPLVPGAAGCGVLVTSRRHLHDLAVRHAAIPVRLGELPAEDAIRLFTRIAGRERCARSPEATRTVVVACGQLPLALRLCASRLALHPQWTVDDLAVLLADPRQRLAALSVGEVCLSDSLQRSYRLLDPAAARAFRLLSSLPVSSFSADTAYRLMGGGEAELRAVLDSLVEMSLLESPAPGLYRFPELLRLFGNALSEQEDPAADQSALPAAFLELFPLGTLRSQPGFAESR